MCPGALMILSWVMLTSIGVMTAKYGKLLFPKVNPCGANIWFQVLYQFFQFTSDA